jgi:arsenite-transporting ATPase
MGEIENIYNELDEMRKILSDRDVTSIRIVVNPEKMVIKEAQRSFTYLNIYNFNVDAVVVNRVMPDVVTDDYFKAWKDVQQKYREMIVDSFSPIPIYYAPLFEREIVGLEMLERLGGEVFSEGDPVKVEYNLRTQTVEKTEDGYVFSINMPFVEKKEIALNQKADELIIKVGNIKRTVTLPRTLLNYTIKGAKFENEILKIRFGDSHVDR